MEELKQFKKQILEAEKYAKVYQESFKRQADNYICSLDQKSVREAGKGTGVAEGRTGPDTSKDKRWKSKRAAKGYKK